MAGRCGARQQRRRRGLCARRSVGAAGGPDRSQLHGSRCGDGGRPHCARLRLPVDDTLMVGVFFLNEEKGEEIYLRLTC